MIESVVGSSASEPREQFGPFRVFERLGVGGTAVVHRALRRAETGDVVQVSLKRLHGHLLEKERAVESFLQEAQIASRMNHENIARFYEVGCLDDSYFMAMEYIEGRSLRELLVNAQRAEEPLPLAVSLSIVCQLCDAIEYLHNLRDERTGARLGLIHRDISPANVLVTPWGKVKLIDLGIAKSEVNKIETGTGIIKGKYGYMAPEVLRGAKATRSVDIFAIGVVMWELLTAERLFAAKSDLQTIARIKAGIVPAPSTRIAAYSPALDDVVLRALKQRPHDRWSSAAAMRAAVQAVATMQHEPIGPTVIADWMVLGHHTPTPSPFEARTDATTAVIERQPRTMPARPPVFPRGTAQFPKFGLGSDDVPVIRAPTTQVEPTPRRRLGIIVALSLAINLVLLAWIVAGLEDDSPAAVAATQMDAGGEQAQPPSLRPGGGRAGEGADEATPRPTPKPKPKPKPKDKEPVKVTVQVTPPGPPMVARDEVRPRRVLLPRSSQYAGRAYSAKLCINKRGRVKTVVPLSGPKGLYRRMKRLLGYSFFRPYERDGKVTPVCFIYRNRYRPKRKR